jgi:hypothetical protein
VLSIAEIHYNARTGKAAYDHDHHTENRVYGKVIEFHIPTTIRISVGRQECPVIKRAGAAKSFVMELCLDSEPIVKTKSGRWNILTVIVQEILRSSPSDSVNFDKASSQLQRRYLMPSQPISVRLSSNLLNNALPLSVKSRSFESLSFPKAYEMDEIRTIADMTQQATSANEDIVSVVPIPSRGVI